MRIQELIIDEEKEESGVFAISFVEHPAIEADFIYLNKEHEEKFAEVEKEKRLVMGAALIPNKMIYRKDKEKDDEYNIYFSRDTIRKISEKYMKQKYQKEATLEHQLKVDGATVVERWIVEDPKKDKSAAYGLEVPKGTWMVTFKVDNEELWNDFVKTGKVKGFSIEGIFEDKSEENLSKPQPNENKIDFVKRTMTMFTEQGMEVHESFKKSMELWQEG